MSKALDYLAQARPEAMGHYFAFLKDAGRHLDPKTRSLISVITKVDAQTERGFKQYLKRALGVGCTPAEILDALLMAFPTLGLSKIVWAVDIILSLDLPGFDLAELGPQAQGWHQVVPIASLPEGRAQHVEADGRGVFVIHQAQGCTVYDARCPHQGTPLPAHALDGLSVTCPKHAWSFDLCTGRCTLHGDKPLTELDCRIEDGQVLARW